MSEFIKRSYERRSGTGLTGADARDQRIPSPHEARQQFNQTERRQHLDSADSRYLNLTALIQTGQEMIRAGRKLNNLPLILKGTAIVVIAVGAGVAITGCTFGAPVTPTAPEQYPVITNYPTLTPTATIDAVGTQMIEAQQTIGMTQTALAERSRQLDQTATYQAQVVPSLTPAPTAPAPEPQVTATEAAPYVWVDVDAVHTGEFLLNNIAEHYQGYQAMQVALQLVAERDPSILEVNGADSYATNVFGPFENSDYIPANPLLDPNRGMEQSDLTNIGQNYVVAQTVLADPSFTVDKLIHTNSLGTEVSRIVAYGHDVAPAAFVAAVAAEVMEAPNDFMIQDGAGVRGMTWQEIATNNELADRVALRQSETFGETQEEFLYMSSEERARRTNDTVGDDASDYLTGDLERFDRPYDAHRVCRVYRRLVTPDGTIIDARASQPQDIRGVIEEPTDNPSFFYSDTEDQVIMYEVVQGAGSSEADVDRIDQATYHDAQDPNAIAVRLEETFPCGEEEAEQPEQPEQPSTPVTTPTPVAAPTSSPPPPPPTERRPTDIPSQPPPATTERPPTDIPSQPAPSATTPAPTTERPPTDIPPQPRPQKRE